MKKMRINLVLALLMSGFIYCENIAMASSVAGPKSENVLLQEINGYRAKQGLEPLKMDHSLSVEAKRHSQEMADQSIPFSHDRFQERKTRLMDVYPEMEAIAENVAFTDRGLNGVVNMWIGSSGHRKNIEGDYRITGLGIAKNGQGRAYVTEIFMR